MGGRGERRRGEGVGGEKGWEEEGKGGGEKEWEGERRVGVGWRGERGVGWGGESGSGMGR